MTFTNVTVVGTYTTVAGTPAAGSVALQATADMQDGSGDIRVATIVSAPLDGAGHVSLLVTATDDPTTSPSSVSYTVTERIVGAPTVRTYNVGVPHTSPLVGGMPTLDLSTVAPQLPASPTYSYVLLSTVGQPGGVASLDGTGHVPSAQLPPSGTGTVTSVTSTSAALTVANGTTTPALTPVFGTAAATLAQGNDARFAGSPAGTAGASLSATDATTTNARTPSGAAGGDLVGTYPNPTLKLTGPGATGPIGSSSMIPAVTIDAEGRVTALISAAIPKAQPGDYGWVGWAGDPALFLTASHATLGGRLWLTQVFLTGAKISNVVFNLQTAGATMTAGQNFVGLYNPSGNQVGASADLSTTFGTTGNVAVALTSAWTPPLGTTWCWVAFLANATTLPQFAGSNVSTAFVNWGRSLLRTAISVATGLTTLPASFNPTTGISDPGGIANIYAAVS